MWCPRSEGSAGSRCSVRAAALWPEHGLQGWSHSAAAPQLAHLSPTRGSGREPTGRFHSPDVRVFTAYPKEAQTRLTFQGDLQGPPRGRLQLAWGVATPESGWRCCARGPTPPPLGTGAPCRAGPPHLPWDFGRRCGGPNLGCEPGGQDRSGPALHPKGHRGRGPHTPVQA